MQGLLALFKDRVPQGRNHDFISEVKKVAKMAPGGEAKAKGLLVLKTAGSPGAASPVPK